MANSYKEEADVFISQYAFQGPESTSKSPLISSPPPRRSFFQGWCKGVAAGASVTIAVLLVNIVVTIAAVIHFGVKDGLVILYQGNCDNVSKINFGIHLVINILGTLLLAASNYCMQVLSAPTRKEVDRAHAQRKWLDIGLSSFRNLGRIRRWRLWVWILLIIGSLPLHLVYNSVVFSTITAFIYTGVVASPAFVNGPVYQGSLDVWLSNTVIGNEPTLADVQRVQANIAEFEKLDNAECISQYHKTLVTNRSDLVLVSSFHNANDEKSSVYLALEDGDFYVDFDGIASWICDTYNETAFNICLSTKETPDPGTWSIEGHSIDYCLSQPHREVCKIKSSLYLMIVVIICNVTKLAGMLATLLKHEEEPLVTPGDAVSSFLTTPDDTTINACLISKDDVKSGRFYKETTHVRAWKRRRVFYFHAVSGRRWWLSMLACGIGIIVIIIFLRLAIFGVTQTATLATSGTPTLPQLWGLGFGLGDGSSFWSNAPHSLYGNILIANLPQLIFSILYFVYNGLYTAMSLAAEWSKFSLRRRGLRVSRPVGAQRSTYYLQLPYTYAVPLIIASALMHWFISQSFYLLSVDFLNSSESDVFLSYVTCGYSPIAIIFALGLAGLMLIVIFVNGFRRMVFDIPPVGSCSAAISASCHAPADGMDASKPLQWGVVDTSSYDNADDAQTEVGHCSFSSVHVSQPVDGGKYAGSLSMLPRNTTIKAT